jgi:hypothetical protein
VPSSPNRPKNCGVGAGNERRAWCGEHLTLLPARSCAIYEPRQRLALKLLPTAHSRNPQVKAGAASYPRPPIPEASAADACFTPAFTPARRGWRRCT